MTTEEAIREYAQKKRDDWYFIDMKDGMRCQASAIEGLIKATFAYMMLHGSEIKWI